MNERIKEDILEILHNNTKNIPEDVYLELCNYLMKFNFKKESPENILEKYKNLVDSPLLPNRHIINPDTGRYVLRTGKIGKRLMF